MSLRKLKFYVTVSIVVVGLSCTGPSKSARTRETSTLPASLVNSGQAWSAAWQQQSGEYKALCFQAYYVARVRLDQILQGKTSRPPAIVTDIDETVLHNSPYTVHQSLQGMGYSDSTWVEWTKLAVADTVPGALSFLRYARSKGVSIIYVTNRLEKEREATIRNLQNWGFPDADNEHLFLKQETSGKEIRRQKVLVSNEIVLLVGDNLSDFSAVFDKQPLAVRNAATISNAAQFGSRFIVLPNPMYGDWEGAYYKFNYNMTDKQKDSAAKSVLKNY